MTEALASAETFPRHSLTLLVSMRTRSNSLSSVEDIELSPLRSSFEGGTLRPNVGELQDTLSTEESSGQPRSLKHDETLLENSNGEVVGRQAYSLYDRFGWLSTTILISATVLILAALGFLWFLWEADHSSKTWHGIAVKNWITRAVALSSLVLRTSISMQASIATSMLAGLALENTQILLLHFASVSTMRNANAGPYMLAWLMFKAFLQDPSRWRRALLPVLVLVLVITSILTQFTSTALLADLKPGTIPGHSSSDTTGTHFRYDSNGSIPFLSRGTVWTKKPPFYPTFAEYHEASPGSQEDKSDTGITIRAFLPLPGQEARSLLRNFSGLATVLDSRVQCVRPQITMVKGHYGVGALALSGSVSANGGQSTNFSCVLPTLVSDANGNAPKEWQTSMTYLGAFSNVSSAPVQSEFRLPTSSDPYGMTFVVVNVTAGTTQEWIRVLGIDGGEFGTFGAGGAAPLFHSNRGEWLDLLFTKNLSLVMSVSMCYASYDTTVLSIDVSSNSNRTEPVANYNLQDQGYDYSSILWQLGQPPQGQQTPSLDERGVLSISKRSSWQPGIGDYSDSSWLLGAVQLNLQGDPVDSVSYETASSTATNITAYLYDTTDQKMAWKGEARISTDPSTTLLFQQILLGGGSIAFAIQSLLTTFTGMSYYDQLQQFNSANEINTTSFILVSKPSSVRGIIAVTVVVGVHLLLLAFVLHRFVFRSSISTVGNSWQTIAQVAQGDAMDLVNHAALITDDGVEDVVKAQRWKRRLVGLQYSATSNNVELIYRDSPGGLAKMMQNARYRRRRLTRRRVHHRVRRRAADSEAG